MLTRSLALAVAAGLIPAAALWAPASADPPTWAGRPFTVELTGAAEAPGPGDPDATGTASLWLNAGQEQLCYTVEVQDVNGAITGAHVHEAPAGEAGPVVIPLSPPVGSGCVDVDRGLAVDVLTSPEDYYVNVHSTQFPAGAVRGQLR